MKYHIAGRRKESWLTSRKNRYTYGLLLIVALAFLIPFVLGANQIFDWKTLFQFLGIFIIIEVVQKFVNKEEKAEGLVKLEFKNNSIELTYFNGDKLEINHNKILAIHKDVTKIVIDVQDDKKVYSIPYSYFSYDDLQKMKIDVDRVSQKISTLPKEYPAYN